MTVCLICANWRVTTDTNYATRSLEVRRRGIEAFACGACGGTEWMLSRAQIVDVRTPREIAMERLKTAACILAWVLLIALFALLLPMTNTGL